MADMLFFERGISATVGHLFAQNMDRARLPDIRRTKGKSQRNLRRANEVEKRKAAKKGLVVFDSPALVLSPQTAKRSEIS